MCLAHNKAFRAVGCSPARRMRARVCLHSRSAQPVSLPPPPALRAAPVPQHATPAVPPPGSLTGGLAAQVRASRKE
jgi:hypothetical protein